MLVGEGVTRDKVAASRGLGSGQRYTGTHGGGSEQRHTGSVSWRRKWTEVHWQPLMGEEVGRGTMAVAHGGRIGQRATLAASHNGGSGQRQTGSLS